MKREPQTNSTKDRLVAWLKKVGKQLLTFLQDAWQRFKKKLKQVWHRYQLTRWLIVVFLSLFLLMSILRGEDFGRQEPAKPPVTADDDLR